MVNLETVGPPFFKFLSVHIKMSFTQLENHSQFGKLTSVFHASVLLLFINFVITLFNSKRTVQSLPFLDILIKRHNRTFSTSIYRKKTFTGLYTKWDSFTPRKYKVNLIRTLTFRCFRICSSPSLLRSCLNELRKLLLQNDYPAGVVNLQH